MANAFTLNAKTREAQGKGASRRLRREEARLPGIIYGGGQAPTMISVETRELVKALENEAFYSHVLSILLDGTEVKAVIKDLQRHPAKNVPTHIDLLRIDDTHKIQMHVPLHFLNEDTCPAVKTYGGVIAHQLSEVLVSCLAKDLPEFIGVDMEAVQIGQTLHLSDLKLPEGVTLVELSHGPEHDLPVVSINSPRGGGSDDAASA